MTEKPFLETTPSLPRPLRQAADLLVQLVRSLLKVLEMHATLLGRGIGGQGGQGRAPVSVSPLLSPYLGGALLWSLTRWASAYLLPDLTLYEVRDDSLERAKTAAGRR